MIYVHVIQYLTCTLYKVHFNCKLIAHMHTCLALYCLINWIGEDNKSVVSVKKIKSPQVEDFTVGCFCKVKSFEGYKAKVEGIGKSLEVNKPNIFLLYTCTHN